MNILTMYTLIGCLFGVILSNLLDVNLQTEQDIQILQLFKNKTIKTISIIILSVLWVPTSIYMIYNNIIPEGDVK